MYNYDSIMVFRESENPRLTELIKQYSTKLEVKQGADFISPGDSINRIFYIEKGTTCHYSINSDGSERIIYILRSGFFIGEGAFARYTNSVSIRHARADTDCILHRIDKAAYSKLITNPLFANAIIASCSLKNAFFRHEIENISFRPLAKRLLNLLCASVLENCFDEWVPLDKKITQYQMASILGANRVSISKAIRNLRDSGKIRVLNNNIQVSAKLLKPPK